VEAENDCGQIPGADSSSSSDAMRNFCTAKRPPDKDLRSFRRNKRWRGAGAHDKLSRLSIEVE
jgi:hypothetical protein